MEVDDGEIFPKPAFEYNEGMSIPRGVIETAQTLVDDPNDQQKTNMLQFIKTNMAKDSYGTRMIGLTV